MKGMTPYGIARKLEKERILSPTGKEQWYSSTVASILQNEKYRGSALLQKKYTVDFLTKKQKVNEGEVHQYYIEDTLWGTKRYLNMNRLREQQKNEAFEEEYSAS